MEISLTNDTQKTMISSEDYTRVSEGTWHMSSDGYVCGNKTRLHTFIMGNPKEGMVWDHTNGNKLDNRRENLREVTHSQNSQNIPKREGTSSQYIGVYWAKHANKWGVSITGKHLGYFTIELDAGKCYDRAALFKFGSDAMTNKLLTETEMTDALEKSDDIRIKSKSVLGTGISMSGKKFRVCLTYQGKANDFGAFVTLEEAQAVSKKFLDMVEKNKEDLRKQIYTLPIKYDTQGFAVVPITNRGTMHTRVDETMWHDLIQTKWFINALGYVCGMKNRKLVYLHRYVYIRVYGEVPSKLVIDHIGKDETCPDMKKLDNRSVNLRAVSRSMNSQNSIGSKKTTSQYTGVYKRGEKWICKITREGAVYHIGVFSCEMKAAEAYNTKAIELYGKDAKLNKIETPEIVD